jgi:hypothetical protein
MSMVAVCDPDSIDRRLVDAVDISEEALRVSLASPSTMGFEKQRQKLKSSQPNWGDQFPARKPSDQSVITDARDKTTFYSPTLTASYDARASKLDALILKGMHAESIIQPRSTVLSTKGWTIESLLQKSKNFRQIKRVPASSRSLAKSVELYEANGKPLVIEGWHNHKNWHRANFTLGGLYEASGEGADNLFGLCISTLKFN